MSNLEHFKQAFNGIGWFVPPYATMQFMSLLSNRIVEAGSAFDTDQLEQWLAILYSDSNLAAMVVSRYPITPFVSDYKETISEAVEAHFMRLDHVAVAGLLPAIEGIALKLADDRSVRPNGTRALRFRDLAEHCKQEITTGNIGIVAEVVLMIDSFIVFTEQHLYANSSRYELTDRTNRHGILHGAYIDTDYGRPINFYKVIAAVDFLCFISSIRAPISWMAPDQTEQSQKLALYYQLCREVAKRRPSNSESS